MPPQFNRCVAIGDTVGHAVPFMHRLDCHAGRQIVDVEDE